MDLAIFGFVEVVGENVEVSRRFRIFSKFFVSFVVFCIVSCFVFKRVVIR